ncbi:MAG: ABC transporter substrate-binding protein [Gammaproteobacteria bacterium]|nr:ABC transporter substrate-binding protein [Gammaproteobacteria bacterium]
MKSFRKTLTLAAAGAALGFMSATPVLAADSITVVSWGGAYTRSQVKAYHEPFEKKTGIKINSEDYNGGIAQIKAQVDSGNVKWDVVDLEPSDVQRACDEGLLEVLDHSMLPPAPDGTPATQDFVEGALNDCAVATIIWSTVYAYDKTKFPGGGPKTIADFFDTKKFPGKRALRKTPLVNLEWALMADGVPTDKVYEVLATDEGVDRAFKKLDTIKDQVVWWEAGAQPPQMLADGEVAMASAYNGRLFNAIAKENKPFEIVWDGQVWSIDMWGVVKGTPNMDAALEFVKFSTDTQRLADQARWISYGPARKSSVPLITTHAESGVEMMQHMPNTPEHFSNALQTSVSFWTDNQDELNERFNTWLAR